VQIGWQLLRCSSTRPSMNWPANSKNRHLSTTEHAEHTSFNHGTHGTHGKSPVLTSVCSVYSVVPWLVGSYFRGSVVPWFRGFWVLTSVYSGVPVSLAVLVSCKVLTMVSARSTPAEGVPSLGLRTGSVVDLPQKSGCLVLARRATLLCRWCEPPIPGT
jgi:hypothetical protein